MHRYGPYAFVPAFFRRTIPKPGLELELPEGLETLPRQCLPLFGADGGTRTHTPKNRYLRPGRLPFPPRPHYILAMNHDDLIAAYSAPRRHYHNLKHVEDCLDALADIDDLSITDRDILIQAIWWHDVVYDATRSDNEELSAQLAEKYLQPDLRQEVARLIRLTKSHQIEPGDRLGEILISIDLRILGAVPTLYDTYASAIRKEFAHIPDDAYRVGRAEVLRRFVARPVIYPDPVFAKQYDRQARENIAREIASLG
jgi:predicted metal-dependent HD superfamily phosphohydrolase